ncbi:MAG TPA: response regulator transcription factor [Blastocatellia bacterium]|nr:response regulator transcription factor [Blastocatellia bacterium]
MSDKAPASERYGSAKSNVIKVAIIEDQRDLREGLQMLINGTVGYRCTGNYRSMEDALYHIGSQLPDVVLVDIGLPKMQGDEGIRILKERYPKLLLVALTVYDDDDQIFSALCAGASGYLLKRTPPSELLESLREVMSGGAPMSPEVASRVVALFREFHPPQQANYHLTPTETQLLKLLVQGHHYKTAAAALDISVNTVKFHLQNIYQKLQVHSKSEAVAKALSSRLADS